MFSHLCISIYLHENVHIKFYDELGVKLAFISLLVRNVMKDRRNVQYTVL